MESGYLETMREEYRRQTGNLPGEDSDIGIRMALLAGQLEGLEEQLTRLAAQADPETAEGEALDRHAGSRGLSRKEARTAVGTLRFSRSSPAPEDIPLPRGLICSAAGEGAGRFITSRDGVIPAGETQAEVPAEAERPGSAGNVPAGTVTVLVTAAGFVSRVENPEAFSGGMDAETDGELRARLLESYANVSNGSNAAYYRRLALAEEGVRSVSVIPRPRGSGSVDLIIAGQGAPADAAAVEALSTRVAEQREIGVDARVTAAAPLTCDVSVQVWRDENYAPEGLKEQVERQLREEFQALGVGEPLYTARLISRVMAVPGVENCRLTAPAADLLPDSRSLAVPGSLTVEEGSR